MDVIDTSEYSKDELVEILRKELDEHSFLYLVGPQGGGKTTISIKMADENVGAIYEGRARSAQPVIVIRRDLLDQMETEIIERRKLPIFDGDDPIYVEVTMLQKLNSIIENVFDLMELGEEQLFKEMKQLLEPIGIVPKQIEFTSNEEVLLRRRLQRHTDAPDRLNELLAKEKQYGIKSNLLGIQGARVMDIINRDGVGKYEETQYSRTVEDFDAIISTKDMSIGQCLIKMIELSLKERKESGILVLHTKDGKQKIISDLVIGKQDNSMIGVTLLEVYVGFRQNRSMYQTYTSSMKGELEVIHSFTPQLQQMVGMETLGNMNLDMITEEDDTGVLSVADTAAAERFGITISVIDPEGNIGSSNPERVEKLENLLFEAYKEWDSKDVSSHT
ncbi:MAG: hypothetical protein C00003105_02125 [ANME-2 cluster archaeon HR1]|nr:MAG: hypothetical protein C00003105_02125 [ANME-2 cluster archaeon HR1]